ncbi:MAG: transposase [Anaerobiospirillum sp.]|nr:transposase [Anaerobiospirillum sp.]
MRTPYEQEIALRHLAQFQHDPTGYLQGLMGQALAHCYEVLLKGELDLQCQLSASATSRAAPARNGYSRKTMASSVGSIAIKVPRLRTGKFEPRLIPKYQRRPHAPEVSGAHALEVQVLHLCSCAIRAGMPTERHEFEQLFLRLFAPRYPELTCAQLTYLLQSVGAALSEEHGRVLPLRYPVVVSARFDLSAEVWDQASFTRARPDGLSGAAHLMAHALYVTWGITAQGDGELIELYRPNLTDIALELNSEARYAERAEPQSCELMPHLSECLNWNPQRFQRALDLRLLTTLRQRGVKDVILLLGPHWQLSWDDVQQHFPFATLYRG